MESRRRSVAGRWHRAGSRPGGEGMRYIRRGSVSPPRERRGYPESTMPRRIAIVEDDAAIRANYADALRKHGYEVSAHAARGEAMGAFRTRLPDLAVIDIGLGEEPDGGFTLCRELRARSEERRVGKEGGWRWGAEHERKKRGSKRSLREARH